MRRESAGSWRGCSKRVASKVKSRAKSGCVGPEDGLETAPTALVMTLGLFMGLSYAR